MPPSIKFNGKLSLVTLKIQNVRSNNLLASKLEPTKGSITHDCPEEGFCVSLVAPEFSGALDEGSR
jgi:hypothetical protein